jgi:hypothetical protein
MNVENTLISLNRPVLNEVLQLNTSLEIDIYVLQYSIILGCLSSYSYKLPTYNICYVHFVYYNIHKHGVLSSLHSLLIAIPPPLKMTIYICDVYS